MKFDDYIGEVYILRNMIVKPHIRKFTDGHNAFKYVAIKQINRFVKRVVAVVVGGLYENIAGLIQTEKDKYPGDENVQTSLDNLLKEIGEPHISGFRHTKEQQDL